MIIKYMDEHAAELATIERLLQSDPPEAINSALLRDRSAILSGLKHERDSAYHLDFYFSDSHDWAVIHDLRLEMGESVAQIDHLLIGRQLDIYIIESKHYNAEVKIGDEGEFLYFINKKPIAVPSPVARNRHHINFLNRYLEDNGLLPSRLGLSIRPHYHNIVLVSPTSRVTLPQGVATENGEVVRADHFLERFKRVKTEGGLTDFVSMARQVTPTVLQEMATRLAQRHIPRSIDFAARYGLKFEERPQVQEDCSEGCHCARCNKRITSRVARYCYTNKEMFAGKVYCFDCQKGIAFQPGRA